MKAMKALKQKDSGFPLAFLGVKLREGITEKDFAGEFSKRSLYGEEVAPTQFSIKTTGEQLGEKIKQQYGFKSRVFSVCFEP